MLVTDYRDFVLVADDIEKDRDDRVHRFTVQVFDSPVGQGEKKERVRIPPTLLEQIGQLEVRGLDQDVSQQFELGEALAGLLLPPYARGLFRRSLDRLRDDQGLRLRLRLADELADLPFEYAYIQDARGERSPSSFLALDPRISIARHEALAVPGDWFEAPDMRRVVVAMATPGPHGRYHKLINLPDEQRHLREALDRPGIGAAFVPEYTSSTGDDIPGATLKDLAAALMVRSDVFHFAGHGVFAEEMGPTVGSTIGVGGIVLADADNQALVLPADRLAEMLRSRGIRLVVLGACETGRRDGRNIWSGVAAALLKAGIPAVVAMQFTVQDTLAAAFSRGFYQGLVAGWPIDAAVAAGRAAMRLDAQNGQADVRDWGAPVLYLRAPGGAVFNPVSDDDARQQAEAQPRQLIEQQVREVGGTGRLVGAVVGVHTEPLEIEQVISERASGLVVGASVFEQRGGRLVVRQRADIVDGTMIGATIGGSSGAADESGEERAIAQLERLLSVVRPVSAEPRSQFCTRCGNALAVGARFCGQCGARAE